jgi:hypothetical protein
VTWWLQTVRAAWDRWDAWRQWRRDQRETGRQFVADAKAWDAKTNVPEWVLEIRPEPDNIPKQRRGHRLGDPPRHAKPKEKDLGVTFRFGDKKEEGL